jgi:hypothetical protein
MQKGFNKNAGNKNARKVWNKNAERFEIKMQEYLLKPFCIFMWLIEKTIKGRFLDVWISITDLTNHKWLAFLFYGFWNEKQKK